MSGLARKRWDRSRPASRRFSLLTCSIHLSSPLQDFVAAKRWMRYPHPYIFRQPSEALKDSKTFAVPLATPHAGILDFTYVASMRLVWSQRIICSFRRESHRRYEWSP
jgi:hypothetical protein